MNDNKIKTKEHPETIDEIVQDMRYFATKVSYFTETMLNQYASRIEKAWNFWKNTNNPCSVACSCEFLADFEVMKEGVSKFLDEQCPRHKCKVDCKYEDVCCKYKDFCDLVKKNLGK